MPPIMSRVRDIGCKRVPKNSTDLKRLFTRKWQINKKQDALQFLVQGQSVSCHSTEWNTYTMLLGPPLSFGRASKSSHACSMNRSNPLTTASTEH